MGTWLIMPTKKNISDRLRYLEQQYQRKPQDTGSETEEPLNKEFILNGNFTDGLNQWTVLYPTVEITSAQFYTSPYSTRFYWSATSNPRLRQDLSQTIPVSTIVDLSLYCKKIDIYLEPVTIEVQYTDDTYEIVGWYDATTSWTQTFNFAPYLNQSKSLKAIIIWMDGLEVFIDNVSLIAWRGW